MSRVRFDREARTETAHMPFGGGRGRGVLRVGCWVAPWHLVLVRRDRRMHGQEASVARAPATTERSTCRGMYIWVVCGVILERNLQ